MSLSSCYRWNRWGNTELRLEPFLIISQCCKGTWKSDTTNQIHNMPGEGEDRWRRVKGAAKSPVLFSQPRQWTVCGCCCVCVLFMRASTRLCGGGGSAMIQWCCDFNSGPRTGGLFSPVALWVTVQSSLGRAVKPVRLRNERRWESKTQSRTEPWWTDLSTAATQARAGGREGARDERNGGETPRKWKYMLVEKEEAGRDG